MLKFVTYSSEYISFCATSFCKGYWKNALSVGNSSCNLIIQRKLNITFSVRQPWVSALPKGNPIGRWPSAAISPFKTAQFINIPSKFTASTPPSLYLITNSHLFRHTRSINSCRVSSPWAWLNFAPLSQSVGRVVYVCECGVRFLSTGRESDCRVRRAAFERLIALARRRRRP